MKNKSAVSNRDVIRVKKLMECLNDNGIIANECPMVAQAIGYILLDEELDTAISEVCEHDKRWN